MAYIWSSDLEIGNALIDNQHKQLIVTYNDLLKACSCASGSTKINETLDFLVAYTVRHFADEEAYQKRINYPSYSLHKKMHDDFKVVVGDLAQKLKTEGPTTAIIVAVNNKVGTWLVNHIKSEDKKISAYLKAKTSA